MLASCLEACLQMLGDTSQQNHAGISQESDALRSLAVKTEGFERTIRTFLERVEDEPAPTSLAAPGASPAKRVKIAQKSKCVESSAVSVSKALRTRKKRS